MPRGKTIVFMDNSNIFHGCKTAGWRIDAKKLMHLIEEEGMFGKHFSLPLQLILLDFNKRTSIDS